MQIVRFVKSMAPYNPGERASFEPERADQLVQRGYVVKEDAEQHAAPPATGIQQAEETAPPARRKP